MSTHETHGRTSHLHVSGGDYLLLESWKPVSAGEMFGSCIVLLIVSILDRLISGLRGGLESYWASRGHYEIVPDALPEDRDFFYIELEPVDAVEMPSRKRIVATSFLLTHDLFRGLLQTTHALFSYTLMLAMMTFNGFYIISIVVGFGLGEMLFG